MRNASPKLEVNQVVAGLLSSLDTEARKKILNRIAAVSNIQVTIRNKTLKQILADLLAREVVFAPVVRIRAGRADDIAEYKPAATTHAEEVKEDSAEHKKHYIDLLAAELRELENEMAEAEEQMRAIEQQIQALGKQPPVVQHPKPVAADDAEKPAVGTQEVSHATPDSIFDSANAVTKQPPMNQALTDLLQKQTELTQRMQRVVAKMILIQSVVEHLTAGSNAQNVVQHPAVACHRAEAPKPSPAFAIRVA